MLADQIDDRRADDDAVRDAVVGTSARTGEPMVGFPIPEEVREGVTSSVADLRNIIVGTAQGQPIRVFTARDLDFSTTAGRA